MTGYDPLIQNHFPTMSVQKEFVDLDDRYRPIDSEWVSCFFTPEAKPQTIDHGQINRDGNRRKYALIKMHKEARLRMIGLSQTYYDNTVPCDWENLNIKDEIMEDDGGDDSEDNESAPEYTDLSLGQMPARPADLKISRDDDDGVVVEMYGQSYPIDLSTDLESTESELSTATTDVFNSGSHTSTSPSSSDYAFDVARGRKKSFKATKSYPRYKKLPRGCRLWEFIRDLLHNPSYNPSHIRWTDISRGEFRLIKTHEIARMWGEKKNNEGMTYEKLSRAMRYYYKRQILAPVLGKRLIYRFGPKSYGWS